MDLDWARQHSVASLSVDSMRFTKNLSKKNIIIHKYIVTINFPKAKFMTDSFCELF